MENVNFLAYRNAVRQAWKDGKITPSELATLETVRQSLNITADEHNQIEEEIKIELEAQGIKFEKTTLPPEPESETAPVSPPSEIPEDQLLLDNGKKAYNKKQYDKAVEYFDKVLAMDPGNDRAQFYKKRSLSKLPAGFEPTKMTAPTESTASTSGSTASFSEPVNPGTPANNDGTVSALNNPGSNSAAQESTLSEGAGEPAAPSSGGDPACSSCEGTGKCQWCNETGKCNWCSGTGKCKKCGGTGKIGEDECSSCKGQGECFSCKGSGNCFWCKGTGKCSKCG